MRRILAVMLVSALAFTAVAAGCGGESISEKTSPKTGPGTAGDVTGESKTLKVGEEFRVELESNPSTGYEWKMTTEPDSAVLAMTGDEYVAPESSAMGAPGNHVWRFKALGSGKTTIVFEYARAWEAGSKPARTHSVSVDVQ